MWSRTKKRALRLLDAHEMPSSTRHVIARPWHDGPGMFNMWDPVFPMIYIYKVERTIRGGRDDTKEDIIIVHHHPAAGPNPQAQEHRSEGNK